MTFSGVITIDKSDVHTKGRGQRSKVKITEVNTNFAPIWAFPDCNPNLNSQITTKWCTKLAVAQKRCPIVFYEVIPLISRSHGTRKKITRVWIHRRLWNDAKTWGSIKEVPYCFSRSSLKFQSHTGQKKNYFEPNWAFSDCNSTLNTLMALKWCIKLDVA